MIDQQQMDILEQIVAQKRLEIKRLHEQFDLDTLRRNARPGNKDFYRALAAARARNEPFIIAEFKRKSPSEGWIDRDADAGSRVQAYARAGAKAVSVLTDESFFGGSYTDLLSAAEALDPDNPDTPLVLQKDFVLDPIQVYLARLRGANIILLIAAILPPERLQQLRQLAERLGMGVIVEVHDQAELDRVRHLDFPVLGVNNRDLKTFRTALNRVNVLARQAGRRFTIAESGIHSHRDFRLVRGADGFLIGTSLMRHGAQAPALTNFAELFRFPQPGFLFKACGIRTPELLQADAPDWIGVNFSPVSRRRYDPALLDGQSIPGHAVAVFYQNSETEIRQILERFPFRSVQLYAGDVTPEFVRSIRQKVLLAGRIQTPADLEQLEAYASDVDVFILDGLAPGSGQPLAAGIADQFPYPFLLAGGLHAGNLDLLPRYAHCVGADIASGIETGGQVDAGKIAAIRQQLAKMAIPEAVN